MGRSEAPGGFDPAPVARRMSDWIQQVVVGLDLCPFARHPFESGRVRIAVSGARTPPDLVVDLVAELDRLIRARPEAVETTLLVHPHCLREWNAFWGFLDTVDTILEELELAGIVQVASFHPHYRFSGTGADAPENYTNRAPFPTLHLLREDSVSRAVRAHRDTIAIPERNVQTMRALPLSALQRLCEPDPE